MEGSGEVILLCMGDLAFFHNHFLYICGHQKDLILVNGLNSQYPQDIEFAVQDASPLVHPGCVEAFSSDDTGKGTNELEIIFEIRNHESQTDFKDLLDYEKIHVNSTIRLLPSRVATIKE